MASSLRAFALGVLGATSLEGKLVPPADGLTDEDRRPASLPAVPARPPELVVARRGAKLPRLAGLGDPAQRVRLLHGWFNHELQAIELFAWALLMFRDAPDAFRRGLAVLLADEQRHARLYLDRLEAHGGHVGDHPVSAYLWSKRDLLDTPLRFVAGMCLTFENANLDHTLDAAAACRAHGDEQTAQVLEQVHREERSHVAFGLVWLERLKRPADSSHDAWCAALSWPLRPALARGPRLHEDCRRELGMPTEFLATLAAAQR